MSRGPSVKPHSGSVATKLEDPQLALRPARRIPRTPGAIAVRGSSAGPVPRPISGRPARKHRGVRAHRRSLPSVSRDDVRHAGQVASPAEPSWAAAADVGAGRVSGRSVQRPEPHRARSCPRPSRPLRLSCTAPARDDPSPSRCRAHDRRRSLRTVGGRSRARTRPRGQGHRGGTGRARHGPRRPCGRRQACQRGEEPDEDRGHTRRHGVAVPGSSRLLVPARGRLEPLT